MFSADQENLDQARARAIDAISAIKDLRQAVSLIDGAISVKSCMQVAHSLRLSGIAHTVYETILTQALNCERLAPGSFKSCLDELERFFRGCCCEPIDRNQKVRFATQSDLERLMSSIDDDIVKDIVTIALNLAGFGGKIVLEKSTSDVSYVEMVHGFTFNVTPMFRVDGKYFDPWIGCVDGYVETVSELNALLESSIRSKKHGFLFLRGASNDVINTLKVNYDRKTLTVVPVLVPFDLEGMNTLVDVATVSGSDVISSTKGQLISSLTLNDMTTVQSIDVSRNQLSIINNRTLNRVSEHVKSLSSKRSSVSDDSLIKLYDKRIKSLIPSYVVVKLVNDSRFVVRAHVIDNTLRLLKEMVEHGVPIDSESLGVVVGKLTARRCFEMLRNVGAIIKP